MCRTAPSTLTSTFRPGALPYPNPTSTPPPQALVQDYLVLRERLRTTRTVVVTPSNYAPNRCTLDAIAQLGQRNARGVAVIDNSFTDAQLLALHEGGIRGIGSTSRDPVVPAPN